MRARALTQRAEALGATLASWSALSLGFAFDLHGLEEAVDLAVSLVLPASRDPLPDRAWSCGVAQGEMEPLADTGQRADLAWGVPLIVALALARVARAGEVLVHPSVSAAVDGTLSTLEARDVSDLGYETSGLRLNVKNPWARARPASLRPAPVAPAPSMSPPVLPPIAISPPGSIPPPRVPLSAPPGAPTSHRLPSPPILSAGQPSTRAASRPPQSHRFPSIPPMRYQSPSTFDAEEADPEMLAARLTQLSKEALIGGDAQALERWSDGLMATGEKDAFAERMRAMARLQRGRVGDALRALAGARRRADEAPPSKRCQPALALAVGLAFAGRHLDALLEGLDALARAREIHDDKAERACLAFLAKLYVSAERTDHAAALGRRVSIPPPRPR